MLSPDNMNIHITSSNTLLCGYVFAWQVCLTGVYLITTFGEMVGIHKTNVCKHVFFPQFSF